METVRSNKLLHNLFTNCVVKYYQKDHTCSPLKTAWLWMRVFTVSIGCIIPSPNAPAIAPHRNSLHTTSHKKSKQPLVLKLQCMAFKLVIIYEQRFLSMLLSKHHRLIIWNANRWDVTGAVILCKWKLEHMPSKFLSLATLSTRQPSPRLELVSCDMYQLYLDRCCLNTLRTPTCRWINPLIVQFTSLLVGSEDRDNIDKHRTSLRRVVKLMNKV